MVSDGFGSGCLERLSRLPFAHLTVGQTDEIVKCDTVRAANTAEAMTQTELCCAVTPASPRSSFGREANELCSSLERFAEPEGRASKPFDQPIRDLFNGRTRPLILLLRRCELLERSDASCVVRNAMRRSLQRSR